MTNLFNLLNEPIPEREIKKRRLAVIDCETDPFGIGVFVKPFIWGFYDGNIYKDFETVNDLLEFLNYQANQEGIYYRIYAHNGGKFDYHFMLEHIDSDREVTIINGRLAKFNIGDTEFRDSYNLFNFALAQYKKDEIDYSVFVSEERNKPENMKRIKSYLRTDCIYLYELVKGFIDEYGLFLTQASAAIKIWQKISGESAPKTTEQYYDDIQPYYYGGRVECFQHGELKKNFFVADITSAYPYAMMFNHPISETYKTLYNSNTRKKADEFIKKKGGITDPFFSNCFFKIIALSHGALPYRDPDTKKLIFPNDGLERAYTITGWEIQAGIRTGTLENIRVLELRYWRRYIDFKSYINHFFTLKKQAKDNNDRLTELFAKLFLNSLYGKFAANPKNYRTFKLTTIDKLQEYIDKGYQDNGFLGDWLLVNCPLMEERQRYYNVATAASITGFVRAYLWESICKCKAPLYCDTDSIAAEDISTLELSNELGGWELEGEFDYAAIGGKKMYAFHLKEKNNDKKEWKIASKGARLDSGQIIKIAQGDTIVYQSEVPIYSIHKPPTFIDKKIVSTI